MDRLLLIASWECNTCMADKQLRTGQGKKRSHEILRDTIPVQNVNSSHVLKRKTTHSSRLNSTACFKFLAKTTNTLPLCKSLSIESRDPWVRLEHLHHTEIVQALHVTAPILSHTLTKTNFKLASTTQTSSFQNVCLDLPKTRQHLQISTSFYMDITRTTSVTCLWRREVQPTTLFTRRYST